MIWIYCKDFRQLGLNGSTHGDDIFHLFRFVCHRIRCFCEILFIHVFSGCRRMNLSLLPDKLYDLQADSVERKTIVNITKLWTNFAKFGYEIDYSLVWFELVYTWAKTFFCFISSNPLPDHNNEQLAIVSTAVAKNRFNYIDITNEGLLIKSNPNEANFNFWNDIFEEYGRYWTPKTFSYNSMAVKVPLVILCSLLLLIGCCKLIGLCSRQNKRRKSMAP